MSRSALAAAGIFAVLALAIWQIPGMKFTAWLCAGAAGVCLLWAVLCRWAQTSRRGKACKAVFLACLCAGAVGFAAIEAVLIFQGEQDHLDDPADAVIVLGAGVNGTVPSLICSGSSVGSGWMKQPVKPPSMPASIAASAIFLNFRFTRIPPFRQESRPPRPAMRFRMQSASPCRLPRPSG